MDGRLLIEAKGITKTFPGVRALDRVDFELKGGETHILLGENGAGKSTLMKILSGAYAPEEGAVSIDGEPVEVFDPRVAQRMGVSIIYQEFNLIPSMNVAQNIYLGRFPMRRGLIDHARMHTDAAALLDTLNMQVDTHALIVDLSTAQQQMVEIAKALSIQSKILIMDEPTSSLSERETEQLFATIHHLNSRGIGIIYISHLLQELQEVGDRVTVLRDGQFVGRRAVGEVTVDELVAMMVGHSVGEMFRREYQPKGVEALRVEGLCSGKRLRDVSLTLRRGEIVGLAGLVEIRELTGEFKLVKAARKVMGMGPGRVVVKREEYGVLQLSDGEVFAAPAYPLETIFDPTGAGDSIAGGFMGFLASRGGVPLTEMDYRRATMYGSAIASFTVEAFSTERLEGLTLGEIASRLDAFRALTEFRVPAG